MQLRPAWVLLALVALAPAASADDLVPTDGTDALEAAVGEAVDEARDTYPHCQNVWDRPHTCLCPWPDPAENVICPIPGP